LTDKRCARTKQIDQTCWKADESDIKGGCVVGCRNYRMLSKRSGKGYAHLIAIAAIIIIIVVVLFLIGIL
jgi:hypothetical protein